MADTGQGLARPFHRRLVLSDTPQLLLVNPGNITLLPLPPYSPELNPVEPIWHYRRSHWLANAIFRDLKHIMDACEIAWQRFAADHGLIRSLRGRLRSRFALPVGGALSTAVLNEKYSRVREFTEIRISPAAWACDPAALCSRHVWPRPPLLRCQRDQARLLDPTASAVPSFERFSNCSPNLKESEPDGDRYQRNRPD